MEFLSSIDKSNSKLITHDIGGCTNISEHTSVCWIPKNASTSVRTLHLGEWNNFNTHSPKELVVFLRNPLERWISGVTEYACRGRNINKDEYEHFQRDVLKNLNIVQFDEHTVPQYHFFWNVNLRTPEKIKFYNLDTNGTAQFFSDYGIKLPHKNKTVYKTKTDFYRQVERRVTPGLKKNIFQFYKNDYKIINYLNEGDLWQ